MRALSTLITEYLRANDMTQAELARASGLSRARINQIILEQGTPIPRAGTLEKLAKGLRLPVSIVKEAALLDGGITGTISSRNQRITQIAGRMENLDETDLDYVEIFVSALAGRSNGK